MTFGRRSESKVIPAKEPHRMPGPQAPPILRNERVTTKTKVISPEAGTGETPSCCNPRTSQQARADKRMTRKFSFIESIHSTLSCQQWRKNYFLAKNNRSLETKAGYRLIAIPQSEFIRAVAPTRVRGRRSSADYNLQVLRKRPRVGPLGPAPAHSQMSLRDGIDVRLRGGIGPLGPAPADWSPYTAPDLCGIPSGDWGLGACAPAQSLQPHY